MCDQVFDKIRKWEESDGILQGPLAILKPTEHLDTVEEITQ